MAAVAAVLPPDAGAGSRRVAFTNRRGQRLVGTLTLAPPGTTSGGRCVILAHGYASTRDSMQLPALAAALADAGFNSLRFDFAGNGESEGTFRFGNYWEEVEDLAAARDFLLASEGQRVVGLLGHSKGGDDVVLFASRYDGAIPRVINVAGRFHMQEGISQRFGTSIFERLKQGPVAQTALRDPGGVPVKWQLTEEDLQDRLSIDMAAAAATIKASRVLTIHGTADQVIPVVDGRAFAVTIPDSRLVEVEGADHNFTTGPQHVRQLVDAVLSFLQEGGEQG